MFLYQRFSLAKISIKNSAIGLALLFALALPAQAKEVAGKIIIAKGEVSAVYRGEAPRKLKRRSKIFVGEKIITGPESNTQIRFKDGGIVALRESTEFLVSNYTYQKQNEGEEGENEVVLELVKGGFRTLTGNIDKDDKYKVKTPVASIGIRGTNYETVLETPTSLVTGVYGGGVDVSNDEGTLELGMNSEFNYSRTVEGEPPEGLLAPPAILDEGAVLIKASKAKKSSGKKSEKAKSSQQKSKQTASSKSSDSKESKESKENKTAESKGESESKGDSKGDSQGGQQVAEKKSESSPSSEGQQTAAKTDDAGAKPADTKSEKGGGGNLGAFAKADNGAKIIESTESNESVAGTGTATPEDLGGRDANNESEQDCFCRQ